jgi:hypothetical protein
MIQDGLFVAALLPATNTNILCAAQVIAMG